MEEPKKYEKPELVVKYLTWEDIVTNSPTGETPDPGVEIDAGNLFGNRSGDPQSPGNKT